MLLFDGVFCPLQTLSFRFTRPKRELACSVCRKRQPQNMSIPRRLLTSTFASCVRDLSVTAGSIGRILALFLFIASLYSPLTDCCFRNPFLDALYIGAIIFLVTIGWLISSTHPWIATLLIGVGMEQAGWVGHDYTHGRGKVAWWLARMMVSCTQWSWNFFSSSVEKLRVSETAAPVLGRRRERFQHFVVV